MLETSVQQRATCFLGATTQMDTSHLCSARLGVYMFSGEIVGYRYGICARMCELSPVVDRVMDVSVVEIDGPLSLLSIDTLF